MKQKTLNFSAFLLFIFLGTQVKAQKTAEEAKTYFNDYKSSKSIIALISKSLPTKEECKLIFKEEYLETYFTYNEKLKEKIAAESQNANEDFVDISIETFTCQDIRDNKDNYAGGMNRILPKLKTDFTFYKVEQLRTVGAQSGMAYKYWLFINNRWVFLAKPWGAFKE